MITEAVLRVILHCSRCNAAFKDDEYDFTDGGGLILWTQEELARHFPQDFDAWDDVQGWIRLGARILCRDCWDYKDNDTDERLEKGPLAAADAAKVARAQMAYKPLHDEAKPLEATALDMPQDDLLKVLDDIRARVAEGDSWEGFLEYLIPDEPGDGPTFAVRAGYRVGNSMGQGGFRLIRGEVPDAP